MHCANCKKEIIIDEGESYYIINGSKNCYDCYIKSQMESTIDSIISPKIRKMITGGIFNVFGTLFGILSIAINFLIIMMPQFLQKYAPNLLSALPLPLVYPIISYNLYTILGGIIFVFLGIIGMGWSIISSRRGAELLIISSIGGTICLGLVFAVGAFWYILAAILGHPDLSKIIPPFFTRPED